jgi:hypothetical protein
MRYLRQGIHRLSHRWGWNKGSIESWWNADGYLHIGLFCHTCGMLSNIVTLTVERQVFGTEILARAMYNYRHLEWNHHTKLRG